MSQVVVAVETAAHDPSVALEMLEETPTTAYDRDKSLRDLIDMPSCWLVDWFASYSLFTACLVWLYVHFGTNCKECKTLPFLPLTAFSCTYVALPLVVCRNNLMAICHLRL
jgi:hypothetical protein